MVRKCNVVAGRPFCSRCFLQMGAVYTVVILLPSGANHLEQTIDFYSRSRSRTGITGNIDCVHSCMFARRWCYFGGNFCVVEFVLVHVHRYVPEQMLGTTTNNRKSSFKTINNFVVFFSTAEGPCSSRGQ